MYPLARTSKLTRSGALPLFTLRCAATGEILRATDPGRALVTGKCADIDKIKVPILRGLAAGGPTSTRLGVDVA
jgi:cytochrome c peroxidase